MSKAEINSLYSLNVANRLNHIVLNSMDDPKTHGEILYDAIKSGTL
jgi:hypothetical protein